MGPKMGCANLSNYLIYVIAKIISKDANGQNLVRPSVRSVFADVMTSIRCDRTFFSDEQTIFRAKLNEGSRIDKKNSDIH